MIKNVAPDRTLDCQGLNCPMPILKTKKILDEMQPGQILEILGTDPGTRNDLPAFAKRVGHEYLGSKDGEGFTRYYIKVK